MRALLLVPLLLVSCGNFMHEIDYKCRPPPDFPRLTISVVHINEIDIYRHCPPLPMVLGCARLNFIKGTCEIFMARDSLAIMRHEWAHCIGYDHEGECGKTLGFWRQYQRRFED